MDIIERNTRERAKNFYFSSPGIKTVKLVDLEKKLIKCEECQNSSFKLYKKIGGANIYGKYNKFIRRTPCTFNYICSCGCRINLRENTFGFAKIKYGCSAGKCPFEKTKMDKGCLSCKYIYEK